MKERNERDGLLERCKGLMNRIRELQPTFRGLETMVLEPGAVQDVPSYLKRQGLSSPIVVADANTYEAAGKSWCRAWKPMVRSPGCV